MGIPARNIWYAGDERYEPAVRKSDYDTLAAAHLKARDKLLELANECSDCDGTGMQTIFGAVLDCPACHDIRVLLA